ncbi:MAG: class I SAM-dependent methyltransferase [Geminicoccaceae bacterium]|nr:class I SAM-dependent methyltransferase [Geminicoccaceae bacterium]
MVEEDPAAFWDARFAGEDYWYGTAPNAWLAREAGRLRPGGAVLVPADGEGRNGVWLAGRGFRVTAVDVSARGLEKARRLAERHGVALDLERADLRSWRWPEACFDGVVAIFAHFAPEVRPILHRRMLQALVPGGLLLLEAYTPEQLRHGTGGPRDPALLYRATDLRADFVDAELLLLEEVETELAEGIGHRGRSAVVRLIARRPAAICGQGGRPLATTCSTETVEEDR